MQVSNSEQLHLIPIRVDVKVRPPKGQYSESNTIRYLVEPPALAATPPATAAPSHPAPVATQSTLPWKRQG